MVFFRGQRIERAFGGQFHVDAEAVGVTTSLGEQKRIRVGNGFQVDVAAEAVGFAQDAGDADDLFHGVIGIANDAR